MKAYVFPGQASQFEGMGKDMYEENALAKDLFEQANDIYTFMYNIIIITINIIMLCLLVAKFY